MTVRTKKSLKERSWRGVGLVVVVAAALIAALVPLSAPPAQAQSYAEGPDYKFFYNNFDPPVGTLRVDWNLYGGVEQLPYYIHADVIDDGFETAVRNAFATVENDPGSKVSFVYMGPTTVLSEIFLGNAALPQDGTNVVSYGLLPGASVGRGGFNGRFTADSTGQVTPGSGDFDVSLSPNANWSTSPSGNTVDVESIVLHELLHAMGLDHPDSNQDTVMWTTLLNGTTKRDLHPADQLALSILYGCGDGDPGCEATCNGAEITHDMNVLGVSVLTGTDGDDVILGTPGADEIDAGDGDDIVCAGGGDDEVVGGSGDDVILGESGDDKLSGRGGADMISGGDGDDTIHGNRGDDVLSGEAGADRIFGYANNDTISGGDGDDKLHGNFGDDVIDGGAGNDGVFGYGDDDTLRGGVGNDKVSGNFGNDLIDGGAGNDALWGADGDDIVNGGAGNDAVNGNSLNDTLNGGAGNDTLDGGIGIDTCNGDTGSDTAARCETTTGVP